MKKVVSLWVLLIFFFPALVQSQEAVQFERLIVELWPEYDDPGVLVIYRGFLSSDVSLPAEVTFNIPAEAGQPNAVAVRGAEDQLMSVQFERVVKGDRADVSFTATSQEIQFEYYDSRLTIQGNRRFYQYTWPANHPVDAAVFQVQRPRGAENMEITPPFSESFQGSDGLMYFRTSEPELEMGQEHVIQVSYEKDTDALSIGDQPVQSSTSIEPQISFSFQGRNLIPWILGGLGILLILGAGGLYWRFGTQMRKEHIPEREGSASKPVFPDQGSYCPQCGSRTGESDRFCRVCGQRL